MPDPACTAFAKSVHCALQGGGGGGAGKENSDAFESTCCTFCDAKGLDVNKNVFTSAPRVHTVPKNNPNLRLETEHVTAGVVIGHIL